MSPDDPKPKAVHFCPLCGSELSHEPAGSKVYECQNHAEMIINVIPT
jgi:ribosomal protein L37AE/L43A